MGHKINHTVTDDIENVYLILASKCLRFARPHKHSRMLGLRSPVVFQKCTTTVGRRTIQQRGQTLCHTRHQSTGSPFAFAFDIDGVLLKSSKPIPGAIEALGRLKANNVPFILLTNGGGLSEEQRTANLTKYLQTEIKTSQFIQSHTPFKAHPSEHGYKNVLVCGGKGDVCRKIALSYGFPHVTIPFDILAMDANIWPYHTLTPEERACTVPLSADPIDAVYVFHDPRDWGLDSTIVLDTLLSKGGVIGTRQKMDAAVRPSVPLYFSNPDLVWANAYPHDRLGQGAFKILVDGLYAALTGKVLASTTIGKPTGVTYAYAERVLKDMSPSVRSVYMVGDNKMSDIMGANAYGWQSLLVRTGVFKGTQQEGVSGEVPATYCVRDVAEAVDLVLKLEGTA